MPATTIIDPFSRKKLMLVGSIGYIISLGTIAWAFKANQGGTIVLARLLLLTASHPLKAVASGNGPV